MATRYAGARTIAYGGRPINQPTQAMGGVKGGTQLGWMPLNAGAAAVLEQLDGEIPEAYQSSFLNASDAPLLPSLNGSAYSVNFRDAHYNFGDPVPLQFIYEAAHWKSFVTFAMLASIEAVWESAAHIAWNGARCVPGSTTNSDDTIGNGTVPFSDAVKADGNFYLDGPGAINPNTTATATLGTGGIATATQATATSSTSITSVTSSGAAGALDISAMGALSALAALALVL